MEKIEPNVASWRWLLPHLLRELEGKFEFAADSARGELYRMAEAADKYNALVIEQRCIREANAAIKEAIA